MNEIIAPPHSRWPRRGFFKRVAWSAASSVALGGLFSWPFDHWLRVERRPMHLRGLGKGFDGARVAHVSDMHCSPIVRERYLRACVREINHLEVDFVVITGDFITGPKHYARRVGNVLRELTPRVATLACLGNHDYGIFTPSGLGSMRGLSQYVADELTRADVFVMLNERRVFHRDGSTIQFVGLEDYWSTRYNPRMAFEAVQPHLPVVALVHNPDAACQIAAMGAQWVLSGHTHGTSNKESRLHELVMPITERSFCAGEYPLDGGRRVYVNRGLSYARRWNLNTRPEITLFTLRDDPV